ncbi:MAG: acetolactate synthase [Planctomycetota bacterium]
MSQASMPLETMRGYAPPVVTQFSVFLDNKVGKLHDLVEAFDGSQCEICAVSVHEASDHAVVRLITNNSRIARDLLRAEGLPFSELDVLVVELGTGHSLTSLCLHLLAAELNIRFAYPLMLRPNGTPTIAIAVDDIILAGQILRRKEYRLLGECDLPKSA